MTATLRPMEVLADGSYAARPSWTDNRVLAASVEETHTVPTFTDVNGNAVAARYVRFSSDANFWANYDATAAIPAADVTDGTGSDLNPIMVFLGGIATIHLIAPANTYVSMTFWR